MANVLLASFESRNVHTQRYTTEPVTANRANSDSPMTGYHDTSSSSAEQQRGLLVSKFGSSASLRVSFAIYHAKVDFEWMGKDVTWVEMPKTLVLRVHKEFQFHLKFLIKT
mmetsp:Transcript_14096/g.23031  ORF Transcript_14096/g.23031 Transcript_14096/m.23031 type:complete len:111 (-) Transcript_14096:302-634(-)